MSKRNNKYQVQLTEIVEKLSHELRTPLGAILGYSELLEKSENLDQKEKEHLQKISTSGSKLLDVINDIIEISNIESGQADIEEEVVQTKDLVAELNEKFKAQARYKENSFSVEIHPSVDSSFIVDGRKLRSIFFSLISNAMKFTEKGNIRVELKMCEQATHKSLNARVIDTGTGIQENDLSYIFEPFWQGESRKESGSGLGLTTCRKLIEILGGDISIRSEYGQGTNVDIQVPIKMKVATSQVSPKKTQSELSDSKSILTALIVDDLPVNRTLVRIMMEMKNFNTVEAENGEQALQHYHTSKPDVVLMDISMPVMDGVEAMKQIRQINGIGEEVPIIAVTAGGHGSSRSELLKCGFSEYIQKPFKERELFEKLSMFLPANILGEQASTSLKPTVN